MLLLVMTIADDLIPVELGHPRVEIAHDRFLDVLVALLEDRFYVKSDELYAHVTHHCLRGPFEDDAGEGDVVRDLLL